MSGGRLSGSKDGGWCGRSEVSHGPAAFARSGADGLTLTARGPQAPLKQEKVSQRLATSRKGSTPNGQDAPEAWLDLREPGSA